MTLNYPDATLYSRHFGDVAMRGDKNMPESTVAYKAEGKNVQSLYTNPLKRTEYGYRVPLLVFLCSCLSKNRCTNPAHKAEYKKLLEPRRYAFSAIT